MEKIIIIHSLDNNKFLAMDGEIQVGHLGYKLIDKIIYLNTTFVDPKYRNGFLGKKLVDRCVDYARKEELKISPVCSFAVELFKRSKKYDDVKIV